MENMTVIQTLAYRNIRCLIMARNTSKGIRHKIAFKRSYQDAGKTFDSESFRVDDLLLIAKLANQAHTWIYEHPEVAEQPDDATS